MVPDFNPAAVAEALRGGGTRGDRERAHAFVVAARDAAIHSRSDYLAAYLVCWLAEVALS